MAIAFDGNGRMYVVEMRTYMQDIDGTGEHDRKSRVSRHESTKGDGKFDKHAVFADGLVVPRMVLPVQDSVLIGETKADAKFNPVELAAYTGTANVLLNLDEVVTRE